MATMTKYYLWAEHSGGQSVGHPCTRGLYEDPTAGWEMEVEAESSEMAADLGHAALERIVAQAEPCDCHRHLRPGSERWWQSVSVIVSRARYPEYVAPADDA